MIFSQNYNIDKPLHLGRIWFLLQLIAQLLQFLHGLSLVSLRNQHYTSIQAPILVMQIEGGKWGWKHIGMESLSPSPPASCHFSFSSFVM